ncbi:hypothetical protein ONE63_001640 [Megalurothrips usitatus]|uniref:Endonuclease/exonuclease/phosphatase domain-containing protein n=1 Tax=Megalurothrips usitatus TaxID=439358 RepID=A0AAV7XDK8_9NEOP|nr:hypothetical protein ONE63_001640 [Megalurothrips usitatus]
MFVPRWAGLLHRPDNTMRVVFHNVRSLRAHVDDIKLDHEVFMSADVLLLAETWLQAEDPPVTSARTCRRWPKAGASGAVAGGVAIHSRLPIAQRTALNTVPNVEAVSAACDGLLLINMCCHPAARTDDILQAINLLLPSGTLPHTTLVCGDFNKDMKLAGGSASFRPSRPKRSRSLATSQHQPRTAQAQQ